MKKFVAFLAFAVLAQPALAAPATSSGASALALAALVGAHSPALNANKKFVLARLLNGHANVAFPANQKISVTAKSVVCKASNVDITSHSCALTFAQGPVNLHGRAAHELFATIGENGVPGDGAAGSIFEALSQLDCTIDPHEIAQRAGGGASCTFMPGAP